MAILRLFSRCPIFFLITGFAIQAASAVSEDETDLTISSYAIRLAPDFAQNTVPIEVQITVKNDSAQPKEWIDINIGSQGNTDDFRVELLTVSSMEGTAERRLEFVENVAAAEGQPMPFRVFLTEPLKAQGKLNLRFDYVIRGRSQRQGFPIHPETSKELYLISDFVWLPIIHTPEAPGYIQFRNIHKPYWKLQVTYPKELVCVIDGRMTSQRRKGTSCQEHWQSVARGYPQVFIGPFDVFMKELGDLEVEIYTPEGDQLHNPDEFVETIAKVVTIYSDLFGDVQGKTYRLVVSHTDWGGHGCHMGAVIERGLLMQSGIEVVAHETAHTWWGHWVSSYGEGSKFLREGLANFSSAWALKQLKGDKYFEKVLQDYKRRIFCPYPALDEVGAAPLIYQEGYDPHLLDGNNYFKAPLLLNALRLEVGDSHFFQSLKRFAERFGDSNAAIDDFVSCFNRATSEDLRPLFKGLLWGEGYPSYRLVSFESIQDGDGFRTRVSVENAGAVEASCELLLKATQEEEIETFKVPAKSTRVLDFATHHRIVKVVIDPRMTGYQYHPDQKIAFWKTLDESTFRGLNWLWYNKSYIHFLEGDLRKAIETLSKCFKMYEGSKITIRPERVEIHAPDTFFHASCLSMGFYHHFSGHESEAEQFIRAAVPGLIRSLEAAEVMDVFLKTGFVKEPESESMVRSFLYEITRSELILRSEDVSKFKAWWQTEGQLLPLHLKEIGGFAPKRQVSERYPSVFTVTRVGSLGVAFLAALLIAYLQLRRVRYRTVAIPVLGLFILATLSFGFNLTGLSGRVSIGRDGVTEKIEELTPLMIAAKEGAADRVASLIEVGADVDEEDPHQTRALAFAASEGHAAVVETLIGAGANVNAVNHAGASALFDAASGGHSETVRLLLEAGADVNLSMQGGKMPLMFAAESGNPEVIRLLVDHGAEIDSRDARGRTALRYAAKKGTETLSVLLEAGADPNLGESLIGAVYYGNSEAAAALLERGADVNKVVGGSSPLLWAVARGDLNCVKVLLTYGARIDLEDSRGRTASEFASELGHLEIARLCSMPGVYSRLRESD